MIELKSFKVCDTFFGARNSHDGFKSMFGVLFAPEKYDKLFILKGGPGTGKSTLLRGAVSFANEMGIDASAVLCSSDVSSLDGVILSRGGKSVAIIDGTAPHTKDPVFPGAIDEIVNLGDGFDIKYLEGRKSEIVSRSRKKSAAYSSAYRTLFAAKGIFDYIWDKLLHSEFYNEAELIADEIASRLDINGNNTKTAHVLYSAFGKGGEYTLPVQAERTLVNLEGEELLCALILDAVKRRCDERRIVSTRYPSALDDRLAERVVIGNTVVSYNKKRTDGVSIGEYQCEKYCPHFSLLYSHYKSMLKLAGESFSEAASEHFALEKIYTAAVDFSSNDKIYATLCQRICDIML
ncbi:MAG: hypothetical protein IKL79_04145 [Clostridia bacterium]|nr:hypothetical protein [Clostridia bacterium]MBR3681176.1 hypothetical protein [Clostridia bacterium]